MQRADPDRPAAPARDAREPRSRFHAVDILLLASLALPALLFGMVATYDRAQTMAAARRDLLAVVETLRGHAEYVFQFQALALGATDEWLRGLSDQQVLDNAVAHQTHLQNLQRHGGGGLDVVVFGADGHPLVESNRLVASRETDVSDREYFVWHRENAESAPYIAAPVLSRASGVPLFFLTRRRSATDGSFAGVIAAGVRQSTLTEYWNRAAPDRNALVTLVRDDGVILARRPAVASPAVTSEARLRVQPNSGLARAIAAGSASAVIVSTSPADGIERLLAVRRLDGVPVFIGYGIPMQAALAPWRRRLLVYGGFAAAAAIALFVLALIAKRRTEELHELNASLERRVEERTAEIQAGEIRLRLLAQEVDHRAKNALAVVQAALRLTPMHDAAAYAKAIEGRVAALARAQTLLAEDRWRGASLQALLEGELAAFVSLRGDSTGPRAELRGPPVLLPPALTQPLAMALHELATNAVKYGALSVATGQVTVSWRITGGRLVLHWAEAGGPTVADSPRKPGFGSRVLDTVVRVQLGGRLSLAWEHTGLTCEIETALARPG
jgi:two-component sensor histidine kinase